MFYGTELGVIVPGNVFDVMEARCVLGVFHWLGAVCAQNISNWKLSLLVMDNSCVDARPSLVLWMLLQLLAPLGELVPPDQWTRSLCGKRCWGAGGRGFMLRVS